LTFYLENVGGRAKALTSKISKLLGMKPMP